MSNWLKQANKETLEIALSLEKVAPDLDKKYVGKMAKFTFMVRETLKNCEEQGVVPNEKGTKLILNEVAKHVGL